MRLRSRCGVRGSDHRAGKSLARAAIRALSVSARGVARAAWRSYSSWAAVERAQ